MNKWFYNKGVRKGVDRPMKIESRELMKLESTKSRGLGLGRFPILAPKALLVHI